MLRLFQSSNPFTFLLLLVYTAIVFAHSILFPVAFPVGDHGIISSAVLHDLLHIDQWPLRAAAIAEVVLILTTGILISFMMQQFKLVNKTTLMPAAVFVLICSYFPELRMHIPEILVGMLCIWLLYRIFGAYNKPRADMVYFDGALISAVATLFYFPAIAFFLFSLFGLLRMRSTGFREFVIYLTGWLTVAFLLGTWIFWHGDQQLWFDTWRSQMHMLQVSEGFFSTPFIVKISLIGVVFMVSIVFFFDRQSANLIQIRKYMSVITLLFLFTLISACLGPGMDHGSLYLIWIPVTVVISYYFFHYKQLWYTEGMHAALLLGTFLFQYITFAS